MEAGRRLASARATRGGAVKLTRPAAHRIEHAAMWALLASLRPGVIRRLIAAPTQERIEGTK